jgi:hypothetical protein
MYDFILLLQTKIKTITGPNVLATTKILEILSMVEGNLIVKDLWQNWVYSDLNSVISYFLELTWGLLSSANEYNIKLTKNSEKASK